MSEVGCDWSSCLLGGVFSVGCAHTGSHVQVHMQVYVHVGTDSLVEIWFVCMFVYAIG